MDARTGHRWIQACPDAQFFLGKLARCRSDGIVELLGCRRRSLGKYLSVRSALESANRICLCRFTAAESDDLPDEVMKKVRAFAEVHIAWPRKVLSVANVVRPKERDQRAHAIFAAVAGAKLIARSRSDIAVVYPERESMVWPFPKPR